VLKTNFDIFACSLFSKLGVFLLQVTMTPYEQFLRQSIEDQKAERDKLFNDFARANSIKKQFLKRRIEEVNQNLALLSADLEKYKEGLGWLREPSKERDEKAEHLPKLAKEEAAPVPAASAGAPKVPSTVTRPTIGKPIGSATPASGNAQPAVSNPVTATQRSTVGTPAGRPQIGSPVGTPKIDSTIPKPAGQPTSQTTTPPRPVVGTPVGAVKRPVIGTPIGTPKQETVPAPKPAEKKTSTEGEAETSSEKSDAST
jgi:hypothetical protein